MKKILVLLLTSLLLLSVNFAKADERHRHNRNHLDYFSFSWNGGYFNYGYPPVMYQPMVSPPVIYVQPQVRQMQQVLVCGPDYLVNTPNGAILQRQCWYEWR